MTFKKLDDGTLLLVKNYKSELQGPFCDTATKDALSSSYFTVATDTPGSSYFTVVADTLESLVENEDMSPFAKEELSCIARRLRKCFAD